MLANLIKITKSQFDHIITFGEVTVKSKNEPRYINLIPKARVTLPVEEHYSVAPHCPICGSGEYMTNEDGNVNDYCGQCGCKLEWQEKFKRLECE